jgi:hypothetical protein
MSAETLITMILGSLLSLSTSLIIVKVNRIEKKADERYKENIKREVLYCTHRSDEATLLLEVVQAVQENKSNGELKNAKAQFIKTNREYENFVRTQAGVQLASK